MNKYIASFVLNGLGDTIGFKNGEWEFNYFEDVITLNMTTDILYDFISLGGINGINLKDWYVSDDTIINMAVTKGLLKNKSKYLFNETTLDNIKLEIIQVFNEMIDDKDNGKNRHYGVTTLKYIKIIDETDEDARTLPYDISSGGNGAAMRAGPIGLAFYGEKNRDLLIKSAIELSKLTHNSAYGYLAGLTMALFSAYAIEEIDIKKWPHLLINLLLDDKIKKNILRNDQNNNELDDYDKFINYWQKYVDTRFDENNDIIMTRSHKNLIFRSRYYYENFTKDTQSIYIGESGFCAMIMAYDSLIDCDGKWEKLVIYAGLHLGDSDTVCAIAGFLYGLLYEFGDVPESNLTYLEFKDELIDLGKRMYERYHS
jgi:ADP-ribosylarginine hydrolase